MLPALREELSLHPGPVAGDGSPTWTLRDPVRNRFFRLGWTAFEILARWGVGSPEEIRAQVNAETTLDIDGDDVEAMAAFLVGNQLSCPRGPADSARFARIAQAEKPSLFHWLLHHYLFIRIPLVRPDRFLEATVGLVGWVYTRGFAVTTLLALLVGLSLAVRQWDAFRATIVDTMSFSGMAGYGVALTLVKVVHELAHAYTAKRQGCRVPTMGVALLVMWPVLYTDVNDAWTLASRRQRLGITAAGVAAELAVAVWSTLAWAFLPEGPFKQAAFVLATVTWVSSLAINLSPFMRFDGYFLLMDALELPNLHSRSFALARWWLRETLFCLGEPAPEALSPRVRHRLIAFAFAVWIYRLILFLGIAALVYHFFIKIVGIGLFAVEMGWFVFLPILTELREWRSRSGAIMAGKRVRWPLGMALAILAAAAVPWNSRIAAPAVLKSRESAGIYLPAGARLAEIKVVPGQLVAADDLLFIFESPDIAGRLAEADTRLKALGYALRSVSFDGGFRERSDVIREEFAAALAEQMSLQAEAARLRITAQAAGTVIDFLPDLHAGDWLSPRDRLATLRSSGASIVEAYVGEDDLARIAIGAEGTFYPDAAARPPVHGLVTAIDHSPVRILADPELATTHGGGIAVRGQESAPIPEAALFRVRLTMNGEGIDIRLRGLIRISGEGESLFARGLRSSIAVFVREWGM